MPSARVNAIEPLGDRGFLARFETESEAAGWAEAVRAGGWPGVVDVVPAYRTVGVLADPDRIDLDDLASRLERLGPLAGGGAEGRRIGVPVLYDGDDLGEVARRLGLNPRDVVAEHGGQDYRVFAIGFQPGFPYAGYLPV
ncbi:MAG: allophanate hydrolase subunit 1, partial [Planctomycetia bacterium]|nr:allophanate hydrolase subunit 1 [Planctomycetia bacterium]